MDWDKLAPPLAKGIVDVLLTHNYLHPTPVQIATIPHFLSRKDVAVEAVTGSGKTLAFIVPIFQILMDTKESFSGNKIGALIIEPTRELAFQTYNTARPFAEKLGFTLGLLTGGSNAEELGAGSCANVIVGTPGRLEIFLSKHSTEVQAAVRCLEVLVLDEADRLYSLGQAKTIRAIIACLPKQRRTGLFSATLEESADAITEAGMRNPMTIKLNDRNVSANVAKVPEGLSVFYAKVQPNEKFALLLEFLKSKQKQKHIIFFSTCAAVEYFSAVLRQIFGERPSVLWLHGKIDKLSRREKIFRRFKEFGDKGGILVTTDLMSRGVDFPDVDWVVQFDAPSNPATFVHRCGRTARLNKVGSAVVFLTPNEIEYVRFIEKNQSVKMAPLDVTQFGNLSSKDVLKEMRRLCLSDRDIYEKSVRAFVSFIQFYRKHECSLIFQLKELDIGQLGYSYGLLQMPRMPEIKSSANCATNFKSAEGVNCNEIAFKDPGREKQRLEMLSKKALEKTAPKEVKIIDPRKMARKERLRKQFNEKKKKQEQAKRRADEDSDWEELAKDAQLIKRLKSGKISEKEYEKAMGLSSGEDD